ncbi:hypothetical protein OCA5_pHCG300960 (plasmid) [Afipia carboxidovorans OM5]|uniref:Uncharacterized protein n=1 Tax=Afipia carboxidovorans (strain ATCC 49405 / DSM 1227 / KCTC 32145 / OM5) TaxID=504832 RepID=F8C159_AFIC5|nr:hypothetical protein [Afipia carboxidovorans]AEI04541.1 hypothetical protein OCA4_pHCG3B00960 [Afipia carboxidovorans OM4]AEI08169.1 hypothetical protein OCA5_pHCG300960 [Afipia carboxidovorans OM5]
MTCPTDIGVLLSRIADARCGTQRQLGVIERQIAKRAERMTITARVQRRRGRRGAHAWTGVDECAYQALVADLTLARHSEIDALTGQLAREDAALTALRVRCTTRAVADP